MRINKALIVCTLTGAALVPAAAYAGGLGAAASVGIGAGIGASAGNFGGGVGTNTGLMGGASATAPGASISNTASGGMGVGTWRDHTNAGAGAGAGVETNGDLRADTHRRPARAVSSGVAKARGIATSGRRASAAVQAQGGANGALNR